MLEGEAYLKLVGFQLRDYLINLPTSDYDIEVFGLGDISRVERLLSRFWLYKGCRKELRCSKSLKGVKNWVLRILRIILLMPEGTLEDNKGLGRNWKQLRGL